MVTAHVGTEQTITLPIPAEFAAFCAGHGLTPAQVLAAFMADLADTANSNGSDERMHASDWFDRVIWPEPAERTYTIESQPAELGGGWKVTFLADGVAAGGEVFPADPNADPEGGANWWNDLTGGERTHWMQQAGNTGRVVDAYGAWLSDEAKQDAEWEGNGWVSDGDARPSA